jgi:hypothetical protein
MEPFGIKANSIALLFAILLSWRGIRKKSLTAAGAACKFMSTQVCLSNDWLTDSLLHMFADRHCRFQLLFVSDFSLFAQVFVALIFWSSI